jgi:hypothetical protein
MMTTAATFVLPAAADGKLGVNVFALKHGGRMKAFMVLCFALLTLAGLTIWLNKNKQHVKAWFSFGPLKFGFESSGLLTLPAESRYRFYL